MRTYVKQATEETGSAPECTGAVLEIKKITRGIVKKADSDYVGCAQYAIQLQIKQPKSAAGMTVFDRIRVGTPEDPEAQKKATWEVSEGGPARLTRFMRRAGVAMADDDEEWIADAIGRTVVAPIVKRGEYTNVGLYYRETDKDCPVIGLATGAKGASGKRTVRPAVEEEPAAEVEETPPEIEEDDDEEAPPKKPVKKVAPSTSDDDEDEGDAPPKKVAVRPAKAAKQPPPDDDDE